MKFVLLQKVVDKLRNKKNKLLIENLTKDINYLKAKNKELEIIELNLRQKLEAHLKTTENIDKYVIGLNNSICYISDNTKADILLKPINITFKIKGNNNTIVFYKTNKHESTLPKGLDLKVIGDNNFVEIYEPNFKDSKIYIEGDCNKFILKKTIKFIEGAYFCIERGSTLIIEENCEIGNGKLRIIANGDAKTKHKILIGKGTHIANDVIIRNSDGETLISPETGYPISEPKDIIIGEHCWITSRCTILKGTVLAKNTIVAANSLVNKNFSEENTLIVGSPAYIKRKNVHWKAGSYGYNMDLISN